MKLVQLPNRYVAEIHPTKPYGLTLVEPENSCYILLKH